MKIVAFVHALSSCWNNGNAHFQRGVLRELALDGHEVAIYEPREGWSRQNLLRERGSGALEAFRAFYPELQPQPYDDTLDLAGALDGADLVIVHEWNPPQLVSAIGRLRRRGRFTLFFHDTHHRGVSDPEAMRAFDLEDYDGVLAFGEALAEVYRREGWGRNVFVWHEGADHRLFQPPREPTDRARLVFIGNWGDEERAAELSTFLFKPARAADLDLDIYGVRYSAEALETLRRHGAAYHGWLANAAAPAVFGRAVATVHVPRRFYASALPGIPTIRVFEALAAGVPLISAPWEDSEALFTPDRDFLMARSGEDMAALMREVAGNVELREALSRNGRETILARHTCRHRAHELISFARRIELIGPTEVFG